VFDLVFLLAALVGWKLVEDYTEGKGVTLAKALAMAIVVLVLGALVGYFLAAYLPMLFAVSALPMGEMIVYLLFVDFIGMAIGGALRWLYEYTKA